ncbi:hypothetical protein chiPu_0022864, partial [Chiloscyllium punctatum]|nr:hypothetical protein [Chiloscyllium punctatum]
MAKRRILKVSGTEARPKHKARERETIPAFGQKGRRDQEDVYKWRPPQRRPLLGEL